MASVDAKLLPNTSTNLKAGKKRRYLVCNPQDVLELWQNLKLSTSYCLSEEVIASLDAHEPVKISDHSVGEELHCRVCLITFTDNEDFRSHYKDDWHRYNLKNKLRGRSPLSQENFAEIECGISSISGSESDDEKSPSKPISGSPKLYFENETGTQMAIYRALLHPKKGKPAQDEEYLELITRLPKRTTWGIIMLGGGHFAAAIYKGADLTHHKTFHSYTVRAKQGGSQSSRDNKSGGGSHPKSAGASLRRYNEAAFAEHVQETFTAWVDALKQCDMIFYRATSSNQTVMFGGKNPCFDRDDPRLRSIPFPTRRATLKEVQRVWLNLATIELRDDSEEAALEGVESLAIEEESKPMSETSSDEELKVLESQRAKRNQKKIIAKLNSNYAEQTVHIDDCELFPGERDIIEKISLAIRQGNVSVFEQEIGKLSEIITAYKDDYHLDLADVLNQRLGNECSTLLHTAASTNKRANIVWKLLELGCDPCLSDTLGKVPYQVTACKESREAFRRFMGTYPDRFDYTKALIPSPLTDEIERQRQEKLAEKRKQQKKQQKAKKAAERAKAEEEKRLQEEALKAQEEERKIKEEKERFLALSDREKRALAAERRILANVASTGATTPVLARCFLCGADMSGKVPFEYSNNKFCSPACLQKHRKLNIK